jgi:hypothetical protein
MNQQLILQFRIRSQADYDSLILLESKLIELLEPNHEVDGHDIDSQQMNIFILSDNPIGAFNKISESKLLVSNNILIQAFHRQIGSDNHYTLWPRKF